MKRGAMLKLGRTAWDKKLFLEPSNKELADCKVHCSHWKHAIGYVAISVSLKDMSMGGSQHFLSISENKVAECKEAVKDSGQQAIILLTAWAIVIPNLVAVAGWIV